MAAATVHDKRFAIRRPIFGPLVPLALALMIGILIDRHADPMGTAVWGALALFGGVVAATAGRWERIQRYAIVAAFVAIGGGRHHARWSDLAPGHLARTIGDTAKPRPAWLRGVIVRVPEYRPPELPDDEGHTRMVLAVTGLSDGDTWHDASGLVRVLIGGDRTDLAMGDAVQAAGSLGPILGPRNPGEADFRAVLRGEGIRLRLSAETNGVWLDPRGRSWVGHRWLGMAREWSRERLESAIGTDAGPLAAALVLGRREAVDPDVNDAFARTGTTHLLAISGLHLAVLALALVGCGRILGLGPRGSARMAALGTIAYAVLVGPMPSVIRSASMTLAVCVATLRSRYTRVGNILALSAIVTFILNPTDLFDIGCQLSFLAVAVLAWMAPPLVTFLRHELPRPHVDLRARRFSLRDPNDPLDALERKLGPIWKRGLWHVRRGIVEALAVSAVVWAVTAPLVAWRFHLVSPIGIALNLPLVPMTSMALVLSATTLGLSAIWPPLGVPTGRGAAMLLTWSESLVHWGATRSWGHVFTPGPAAWWLAGFYALVVWCLLVSSRKAGFRGGRRGAGIVLGGWLAIGALLGLAGPPGDGPEVEVLAVDHGLAVIVRGGDGRTVLYDCGRMRDPKAGRRVIAPALWSRGLDRIDTVVLSHADADHYNGLPDLLDRFEIGEIVIAPGFGESGNIEVQAVLDRVRLHGVVVRTIAAGEPWPRADTRRVTKAAQNPLRIEIEHPPRGWLPDAPDNDRSLVLTLSDGERRVLLTGDLDGAGLAEIVARPSRPFDAVLAPHHGGRTANPPWFYRWARPGVVVVSQAPPMYPGHDALSAIADRSIPVLRTWEQGAIRLRWSPTGLSATGFLDDARGTNPGSATVDLSDRSLAALLVGPMASLTGRLTTTSPFAIWLAVGLGFVGGAIVFTVAVIVEWGAWSLVRPGQRNPAEASSESPEPPPWEPIAVTAADGVRLEGAYRPASNSRGRLALLVHGFAEDRSALRDRAEALVDRGWDVALIDQRSRGRSGGDWTTFGAIEAGDLRAWIDFLESRNARNPGASPSTIVAWGRSMGVAVVLRAAVEDARLRALVLEAPYAELSHSVAAWFRRNRLPGSLAGWTLQRAGQLAGVPIDRPRPIDLAARVHVPVLILHGSEDRITPTTEVRRLAAAFPTPPIIVEVPDGRHVDLFEVGGDALADRVAAFLETAIPARP